MLTLILVFTGFLILAVIGVIIDAQTRHIIVLIGADRYELKKCLNHFVGAAATGAHPDAQDRQLQYHAKISDL
jgi:hypothetical protein